MTTLRGCLCIWFAMFIKGRGWLLWYVFFWSLDLMVVFYLQRKVILCSHDILASSRDNAVLSALTRHPYFQPDVSSDSATTTSIKGYTDGYKSGSETIQRSDDITVDSAVAGKRRIKFPVPMDNDQKTDDSSISPNPVTQKPAQRASFSGKQIPYRASCNSTDDGDKRLSYRKVESCSI